jgi:glycerol kinase
MSLGRAGMPKYVAAIDQRTTSTRCMLVDHAGEVVFVKLE